MEAVDFSVPILNEYWTIAIPIKLEVEVWSFLNPFDTEVWIASLVSIPIFMLAMITADYLFFGTLRWKVPVSFVLRDHTYMNSNFWLAFQVESTLLSCNVGGKVSFVKR